MPTTPTQTQPTLTSVAAHLYVHDLDASIHFFIDKLGFTVDFLYGDPPFYGQVRRDSALLILRSMDISFFDRRKELLRDQEDLLSASITLATADEITELFRTWQSVGVPFAQTLRDEPWQAKTFIVRDPDANLILFAGPSH